MKKADHFAAIHWLRAQYNDEAEHSSHVAMLALQLFDQLFDLHQLGKKEREILNAAALLHDIGQYYGFKSHHRSSRKIILRSELSGWKLEEKRMIAMLTRYHRKSPPSIRHKSYRKLEKEDKIVINKLAAILRLADGLDRSHSNAVQKIECVIHLDEIYVNLFSKKKIPMERYGFEKKKDLFKTVYKKNIVINNVERKKKVEKK